MSESDFYKSLKEILDKINPEDEDGELLERLKNGVELENLLPIQRGRNNGSIPRQIHEVELKRILENASKYLPFLNEKDSDGYDAKEKIIKIFEFRIPYYVGPLSARHKEDGSNAWVVRKEEGRIYPWNFDKKVDREKSNEEFIARMTNKCTYLLGEDVLPKNSLLYSEYMVLNELNNLSVRGEKIPIETKKDIFNRLFKEKAKVSEKDILEFLKKDFPEIQKEDLGGFKDYFKTSLKSYLDFKKQIFGSDIDRSDNRNIVEDIIKWKTIYDDDKKMIEKVISEKYPDFYKENKEKMGKIHGFRYSGWGNFSYKFLKKIQGCNKNGEEFFGEGVSVITALWETNNNLMQLLSDRYTFKEEVDKSNIGVMGTIDEINYDSLVKDLYVSPANKREIWQTIRIAEEVKKVMGCAPKKIFIEMARGEDDRKAVDKIKSEKGRKEFLKDLYANCEDEEKIWDNELSNIDERDFTSIKLYLYSTQMGKCMYTGEKIDLDELMSGNSKWDRDHIYPQSKIKDDSIDNLVLVNKKYNAKKSNDMLSEDIQKANRSRWKYLYEKGFISKKKYERLNRRTDFTEDELAGFISRQLVETRQATKAVADLFKQIYPKSKIVYVKARLVSDFRKRELDSLKSRLVNDYHHAKDAYLNIVVGNVYNATFTDNIYKWLKENKDSKYSINSVFYRDRKDGNKTVWEFGQKDDKGKITGGTMDVVRSTVEKNNILYTEYSYCEKGELFNEMPKKKGDSAAIPLKSGLRVEKHGGYNSAKTSYFAMVEFDEKKGERVRKILAVPVYISNIMNHNHNAFIEYCEKTKGLINVSVIFSKIKKNSIISTNGFSMRIRGESEPNLSFKNNIQLILDNDSTETIRRIEKLLEKKKTEINEERDGISGEALNDLFEKLIHKFETVYKERPSNPLEQLKKSKEIFESSENLIEKATTIDGIVRMLRCDNETKADLSFIGGKKNTGSMLKNTNALCKNKITIINQSVTGLFEKRIHL